MSELIKVADEREKIVQFIEQKVRRIWYNNEWYIVINDVVQVLTDSTNPGQYYSNLKHRIPKLKEQMAEYEVFLPINCDIGKRNMKCAIIEGIARLNVNILSPKGEPLLMWLVQISEKRLKNIKRY